MDQIGLCSAESETGSEVTDSVSLTLTCQVLYWHDNNIYICIIFVFDIYLYPINIVSKLLYRNIYV